MRFYLGTHQVNWLWRDPLSPYLFVSQRRLSRYRKLRAAQCDWALDSGGFTELHLHGRWVLPAVDYVASVRRYVAEIGRLQWAAPQDWMCEPSVRARTGLTVADHQQRTIESVLELRALAPEIYWVPVLQGQSALDYLQHAEDYERAGIDLRAEALVGLGSVCRRSNDNEIVAVVREIATLGISMHGFGVKRSGARRLASVLTSADSVAWSYRARRDKPLEGCTHKSCANCPRFAAQWVNETLSSIDRATAQQDLFPTRGHAT